MSKFQNYLKTFDITSTLTEEDIDKTLALLQIYGPAVRRTASRIGEMEEECYEGRRQSISDFINLAIDYDRDTDRKRIADRLAEMGHSMQLLSVMEDALVLVKDTPPNGGTYFNILQARYFDVYCTSNEEAYLNLGISSSTYYRHIKPAIRAYAASLWCVVIPDLIIREHLQQSGILVVKSIDRFGRNYSGIRAEWEYLTKTLGVDIVVLDTPILDTTRYKDLLGSVITDIVLAVLSFGAQLEVDTKSKAQAEGIAAAHLKGVKFGRPKCSVKDWDIYYPKWKQGKSRLSSAIGSWASAHQHFIGWCMSLSRREKHDETLHYIRKNWWISFRGK